MALNPKILGKTIGPITKSYTWKDVVLYALGVGAGFSDIQYCYENGLQTLPSFAVTSLYDFMPEFVGTAGVNPAGVLHGEQELQFHAEIPVQGTWSSTGRISGLYDKGKEKGAIIVAETETRDSLSGKRLFSGRITLFARFDGGFKGSDSPKTEVAFPDRAPDHELNMRVSPDQPLLFRLSGDLLPLHADAAFARAVGFDGPILHGLCLHGFACRGLISVFSVPLPSGVRAIACRFTRPLYPGTPIRLQAWHIGGGSALWRLRNAETEQIVIDRGIFEFDFPSR